MNLQLAISKGIAYTILILIAISFFLYFVTVPFASDDPNQQVTKISVEEASYPEYFNLSSGFERVATEEGIIRPEILLERHIQETKSYDIGYIRMIDNGKNYTLNWEYGEALSKSPYGEAYIENSSSIVTRENNNDSHSLFTTMVNLRYFSQYGSFRYVEPSYFKVEDKIQDTISERSYKAVEAWQKDNTDYVRYSIENKNIDSEIIITEEGLIHDFFFKSAEREIIYRFETGKDSPALLKPKWYV